MTQSITSEYETITPTRAREYLGANKRNRTASTPLIEDYASDMKSGRWRKTHQGIAFGADGELYDGQQRLLAIVKSNVPVNLLVTRGLPPEAREEIDTGRKRTARDNLAIISGVNLPAFLASALNIIWINEHGVRTNAHSADLNTTLMANLKGAEMARGVFVPSRKGLGRSGFVAAFIYAYPANPAKVEEAARNYYEGTNLASGDAMFILREYALTNKSPTTRAAALLDFRRALSMIHGELENLQRQKVQKAHSPDFLRSKVFQYFVRFHKPGAKTEVETKPAPAA